MKRAYPTSRYDLLLKSVIITTEKPNKGFECFPAENQHQLNKLIGYLPDGKKILIGLRPGKGGVDFNKITSGKVYALAIDGFSPVYEKNEKGQPDYEKQKTEKDLPYYTGSGAYTLSTRDHPALKMYEAYARLAHNGTYIYTITHEQLENFKSYSIASVEDIDLLGMDCLMDMSMSNLVSEFDEDMNKKRKRAISRAKEEAEDNGDKYDGVEFAELTRSPKDGNPFFFFALKSGSTIKEFTFERETLDNSEGTSVLKVLTDEELVEAFNNSVVKKALTTMVEAGETVKVKVVMGYAMRTSVSFRGKLENFVASPASQPGQKRYGDATYIYWALRDWTKSILSVMHSMHPNFPTKDYDAHHYVVAPRQAEVGMFKDGTNPKAVSWSAPEASQYNLAAQLFNKDFEA